MEDHCHPGQTPDAVQDAVNEDRRITIRKICRDVDTSFGSVETILTEDLNMGSVTTKIL